MFMTITERIQDLFPARPGESVEILASAAAPDAVYVLVMAGSAQGAGQFLLVLPDASAARLVAPEPSLDALGDLGVPVATAAELRAQAAHWDAWARSGRGKPQLLAFDEAPDTAPAGPPATQDDENAAICAKAVADVNVLISAKAPYTQGGALACAWAVNQVVQQATGKPVGGGVSTILMYQALKTGRGTAITDPIPGAIVISPTQGTVHGHVGIVGDDGLIYSNSSAHAVWMQNFTIDSWNDYYRTQRKLDVLYYTVNL